MYSYKKSHMRIASGSIVSPVCFYCKKLEASTYDISQVIPSMELILYILWSLVKLVLYASDQV